MTNKTQILSRQRPAWLGLGAVLVGLGLPLGCTGLVIEQADPASGAVGVSGDAVPGASACRAPTTKPTMIRRLNRREYTLTVQHLLGITVLPDTFRHLPPDEMHGFDNNADLLAVSDQLAGLQAQAALELAALPDVTKNILGK